MNQKKNTFAVLTTAFMSFVGILTETSLNVTFPAMMKQFGVSLDVVQWTTTGYLLMIAIIMISSSYQNKRFTAHQLFTFAGIAFVVGSLCSAFAVNFSMLLIGRLISAFGAGLSTPMMFNLIVEVMPRQKWGFYMGIAGLVLAMAPTLGPSFGGVVSYYLNWRWIFIMVAIFGLLVFLIGVQVIGQYHPIEKASFDWSGYILLSGSLVLLVLGINEISHGLSNWKLWIYLLLSAVAFIIYLKLSKQTKKQLLDLRVFKYKAFIFGSLAYFSLQLVNIGISFVLPNYTQIVSHQSSMISGLLLLPGSIIAGVLNPYFGNLYDRRGAKLPLYLGGSLMLLACCLFAIWGLDLTIWMVMGIFSLLMLGHRMSFSNTMAEALKIEPAELHSDATAICQTAQQLAGSVGTTVLAAIIAIFQNQPGHSYAYRTAAGSQMAFYFTLGISILILICDFLMIKFNKKSA